jgi:hypothetical protein
LDIAYGIEEAVGGLCLMVNIPKVADTSGVQI